MNLMVRKPKPLVQFGQTPFLTTPAAKKLTPDSPAFELLTDFKQVAPQSVASDMPINEANLKMRHSGVRLLFVIDPEGHCIGVLTSKEVIGTRRVNLAMQQRQIDREEVTAEMIMTPWEKLSAMPLEHLESLSIQDLILSMESFTEQHLLITEHNAEHALSVRGLISVTDIQNAIGKGANSKVSSSAIPMASSFADICQVITGHDL
ncbi:CBS domain-containing protein [Halomonas sp. PAMB 3232]|uniref:CBS domain-containing protein n=1 Tax=Halomonas sp. PAMB 3232 TaxID=3075221 RepID=UPI0028A2361C|nr:CBS domain-containing protein [Halomonas sp. PAMB 3232]WNL38985.1 CBS domain-containing protein [Halomonas sp. PAMB 3232]